MDALRLFLFSLLLVLGMDSSASARPPLQQTQTRQQQFLFADDLNYLNLDRGIRESLLYLKQLPPTATVPLGNYSCPVKRLMRSLVFFRNIITGHPSAELLTLEINTYFDIYQPSGISGVTPQATVLVTGYYQPVFSGSSIRKAPFLYPLYSIPANLVLRHEPGASSVRVGRFQAGRFTKYWTRQQIETRGYAKGNELVYLQDPFDAFLLHIQGSGLIRLRDGSLRGIHYAVKNGRSYKSIGRYMVNTGRMKLKEASIQTIRKYLDTHPKELKEILYHNESFIFFNWTTTHDALGNLGRPLTKGRSVAVDQHCLPAGGLAFLQSIKPVYDKNGTRTWLSFGRFVLAQDTGSAIRGPGRVDLFWGTGKKAGKAAGEMKETGALYFFLLKEKFL